MSVIISENMNIASRIIEHFNRVTETLFPGFVNLKVEQLNINNTNPMKFGIYDRANNDLIMYVYLKMDGLVPSFEFTKAIMYNEELDKYWYILMFIITDFLRDIQTEMTQ